jgi:cysteine desulfurase / selenocysteine lyase
MSFVIPRLRTEFPILMRPPGAPPLHYLDNAATGQMPEAVIDAVAWFDTHSRANVLRGVHQLAERATQAYAEARAAVARYLGVADADEIVFTSGTTGAINLVARSYGDVLKPGDEIVISGIEHHSNLVPWQMLRDRRGLVLRVLPVTEEGRLDTEALARVVTAKCKLIAVTHVSNVTGAVSDVPAIVAAAKAVGAKVLLDGAQRAPHGPIDLPALGVDFYAISSHKMFGPTGIGALWARKALLEAMPPLLGGGEMIRTVTLEGASWADVPHKFEAGTPPITQAVGLGTAVEWLMQLDWPAVAEHEMRLTQLILDGLSTIKDLRVLGPSGLQSRVGVISFAIEGAHPHDICQILDRRGVALRGGHHCAQPLMERFGLAGTTRASLALYNDDSDVEALIDGLGEAIRVLR